MEVVNKGKNGREIEKNIERRMENDEGIEIERIGGKGKGGRIKKKDVIEELKRWK